MRFIVDSTLPQRGHALSEIKPPPLTRSGVPSTSMPSNRLRVPATRSDKVSGVSTEQRYRLRNPASGREVVIEAQPDEIYRDRDSGEELEIVGKLLPLAPSGSKLPWAVENLRFCPWCDQLAQKDLNDCPTCGRRMGPLGAAATA
jgi:hypothetical protein